MPILHKIFQKVKEGTLHNSFYEVLIPKPDKDIGIKEKEKCKPISQMNVEAKISKKV